jgi:hypothetical protein
VCVVVWFVRNSEIQMSLSFKIIMGVTGYGWVWMAMEMGV